MYWICFGDSAKGTLRQARHDFAPEVAYDHILALLDNYSEGDIRDVTDRVARADILMPWRGDPELDGEWQAEYQAQHWRTLDRLDEADEAVIWYGKGNAREQCGLRYVVSRLQQRHIPVWVCEISWIPVSEIVQANNQVRGACAVGVITGSRVMNTLLRLMPQFALRRYAARIERRSLQSRVEQSSRTGMAYFSTVGEAAPNLMPYFYQRRRQLTETEQAQLLSDWRRLQEENTPLRAMVDGKLQSVPADFYDAAILSCVPAEESSAALTVGRAIAKLDETGNRVGDMLIFARIRALARAGQIVIVHDAPNYRDLTIYKCST